MPAIAAAGISARAGGVRLGVFVLGLLLILAQPLCAADALPLGGKWRFALDRADAGVAGQWFTKNLADEIALPGALQAQGYGDEISAQTPWVLSLYDRFWNLREDYQAYTKTGAVKVPFLSQPPRHYLGAAWYQREIVVPANWQGRRVVLNLERPHWETSVWLDDKKIGTQNSLVAPHVYDLGLLAPGRYRLSIRVDNRLIMPYRPDAHSVSDSLGGSWNGIVGNISLSATTPVWLDDAQIFPDVAHKSVLIKVKIGNTTGAAGVGVLTAGGVSAPVTWDANGGAAEINAPLDANTQTWDEFHPALNKLTLQLKGNQADDSHEVVFGLRDFRAVGNQFHINGRIALLRGTHHGGDFPLTGYPPTDVDYWRKIFRVVQSWGLNHVRFHSFCPPDAAFTAADELGLYLQPEPGMWNEVSPGTPMERMLYDETERMVKAYGNHPSFVMLSPGNEPKGRWKEAFDKWITHYRQADPRRLYTNGTGHTEKEVPNLAEGSDYLAMQRIGPKMLRGNTAWFGGDYSKSLEGIKIPVASHELGQWCAYPDFAVTKKFTGYLRPGNYEIFRDSLAAHGLADMDKDFAWASGRFQLAAYKEEIEANLRTPGLGGFQLLDLHDYLGQGTALVGLLDAFWEEKGYAKPAEFRRFCSETVPLARLPQRVFTTGDKFAADVEISHFGAAPLVNAAPSWKIMDAKSGAVVAQGAWPARDIPLGKGTPLGKVAADLSQLTVPREYKLTVSVRGANAENDWNFWVYPADTGGSPRVSKGVGFAGSREVAADALPYGRASAGLRAGAGVLVTSDWDEAETKLRAGGKVLFVPRNADLSWNSPPLDTVPVFWNRFMGPAWSRMLGLWSDVKHPALAQFPTAANYDWQWAGIIRNVRAVNLDKLPRNLRPIVYAVDDWNRNYKLGAIFECKVGRGRLLVSAFDLAGKSVVARQLRRSLLDYVAGNRFQPRVAVAPEDLRGLFFDTRIMQKLGAKAEGEAAKAFDGDPNTFWLVSGKTKHPYDLQVSFAAPAAFTGLVLMPRQNHREHEGDIREYALQVSDDGQAWREIKRGALVSTFAPQEIHLGQTVTARYLKLTALNGFGPDNTAALAELAVIYAGPKLPANGGPIQYQRSRTASTDIEEGPDAGAKPKPTATPPQP